MSDAVSIRLSAQFGNYLFKIAAGYAFAKRTGRRLILIEDPTRQNYCREWLAEWPVSRGSDNTPLWMEPRFSFCKIPHDAKGLRGYFQSEKYFAEYREEIRRMLMPPVSFQERVREKWQALLTDSAGACTVHIRRGDYFAGNNTYHGILTDVYFRRAMDAARTACAQRFLVFSDDLEWCRRQPWLAGCEFVDEPNGQYAMFLLTQFPMLIGSNSTFSWWGAYLGVSKQVWVPDRWFGPSGPRDYSDIYVNGWNLIPVS
jgi:hypothetical protein